MIFAVRNINTGDTVYIKAESPLSAIMKSKATIPGAKRAKIETLTNAYYFKHNDEMFCVCRNEVIP